MGRATSLHDYVGVSSKGGRFVIVYPLTQVMPSAIKVVIHSTSSSACRSTEQTRLAEGIAEAINEAGAVTVRLNWCGKVGM